MKRFAAAVATTSMAVGLASPGVAGGVVNSTTTTAPPAATAGVPTGLPSGPFLCGDPATPAVLFPSLDAFVGALNGADAIHGEPHWPPLDPAAFAEARRGSHRRRVPGHGRVRGCGRVRG